MGSEAYKSNFDSFMKEIEPDKKTSNAPSNRAEPFFFIPFPFHIKAKGNNSLTITDICGVRNTFNKRAQGPINILFPEEPEGHGRRLVSLF